MLTAGINVDTKKLQKKGLTLDDSICLLDTLKETMNAQKNNPLSRLYDCALGDDHTKLHSAHDPDSLFELSCQFIDTVSEGR